MSDQTNRIDLMNTIPLPIITHRRRPVLYHLKDLFLVCVRGVAYLAATALLALAAAAALFESGTNAPGAWKLVAGIAVALGLAYGIARRRTGRQSQAYARSYSARDYSAYGGERG